MKIYQLKTVQNLPIGIKEAWEFFSNPNNLSVITPEWLNFKVTSKLPDKMYTGMIISCNYVVRDVADEQILVVQGKDDGVRAFYNVCRHRGSVLCTPSEGTVKGAFVCPYHSWAYDLEGRLVGTPNVRAEDGLDRGAYGLRSVGCEVWEGFAFVNLADEPRPLAEQLAEEPDGPLDYGRYGLGELRTARRITYEVEGNWKIVLDNFNE